MWGPGSQRPPLHIHRDSVAMAAGVHGCPHKQGDCHSERERTRTRNPQGALTDPDLKMFCRMRKNHKSTTAEVLTQIYQKRFFLGHQTHLILLPLNVPVGKGKKAVLLFTNDLLREQLGVSLQNLYKPSVKHNLLSCHTMILV